MKNFEGPLEASLFDDNVPTSLFFKILEKANVQYRPLFHRYNALKKKILNLDTMYNYDLNIPLVQYQTKKYTIDECFDIILDVVQIFGEDYVNIIKKPEKKDGLIIIHMLVNVLVPIQVAAMIQIHIFL